MTSRHSIWTDRGLLLARLALGLVFVMHGGQKLFVFGHDGVTAFMSSLGLPFPAVNAVLITAVELGGGLALLAGAATRIAALLIAGAMTVATITVHLPNGFFLPNGVEFAMSMGLVALSLAMTGAGRYSVDALVARRRTTTSPPQSYRQAA
jgi:putative oxidoreductase